jgi:hypothetical protein
VTAKKPKEDDPAQSKRFIDTAREVETNDDPAAFERLFKRVAQAPKPKKSS